MTFQSGRRRTAWFTISLLLSMAFASSVNAQGFSSAGANFDIEPAAQSTSAWGSTRDTLNAISRADGSVAGPLPMEQAFTAHVSQGQGGDVINLVPAQGYMIYRHTLELFDAQGNAIQAQWPQGKAYDDGEFGQVRVFDQPVRLELDREGLARVNMQGCQANGICYPPMQAIVPPGGGALQWQIGSSGTDSSGDRAGTLSGGTGASAGQVQGENSREVIKTVVDQAQAGQANQSQPSGQDGWLVNLMSGPAGLIGFLLVGVLMAFSPCLLPMLPVTVSLVAGQSRSGRWALAPVAWFTAAHAAVWAVGGFLAAGSGGILLSAKLQSPAMLAAGAGLFLALGAWQMGWIQVRMPQWSGIRPQWRENGMGAGGAMALGATSALVLGPCAAPLLAGALLAVAQAGDPWMGAVGLGLMGIGMCIPMLALAAGGSGLIARMRQASSWIAWVGGSALWAVAMVLASRILDPQWWPWLAAAWAALAMAGLWSQAAPTGRARAGFAVALGAVLLTGAGSGISGKGPWAPSSVAGSESAQIAWQDISARQLDGWVRDNGGQGMVWVVADWCSVCKQFDRQTLSDARVAGRLKGMNVARVDITDMGEEDVALLNQMGLVGPPGVLFFDQGQEDGRMRLVGFEDADAFLARLGPGNTPG